MIKYRLMRCVCARRFPKGTTRANRPWCRPDHWSSRPPHLHPATRPVTVVGKLPHATGACPGGDTLAWISSSQPSWRASWNRRGWLCGLGAGWCVAAEDLAAGAVGAGGPVGEELDVPAPAVDADVVVVLAQQDAVPDAGRAAVLEAVSYTHLAAGGAPAAAAGSRAVLIAQDHGPPDRLRDVLRVPDVDRHALPVARGRQQAGAQHGGEGAGAGHEVDREPGHRVLQRLPRLGGCLLYTSPSPRD